jgi:hypothetical protein
VRIDLRYFIECFVLIRVKKPVTDDVATLIMSWYYAGYYTGYYQVMNYNINLKKNIEIYRGL